MVSKRRYEARLGLRKIDETRNELQVKEYFRKRIEKRSAKLRFRLLIPESFRLFVPHEKSELSEEKTIQSTWLVTSRKASKILYPCNLLLRQFEFPQPLQGNRRYLREILPSCWLDFVLQKSCWIFREKCKFDGTSMEFGLSLSI